MDLAQLKCKYLFRSLVKTRIGHLSKSARMLNRDPKGSTAETIPEAQIIAEKLKVRTLSDHFP